MSDCQRAAVWWQDVMGFKEVNHVRGASFEVRNLFHDAGIVVPGSFDERRIGLDHLAFGVSDRGELQQWAAHLDANGVTHSGIIDIGYGPTVVVRDPDNIQLDFYVHPPADALARRYGVR